MRQDGIIVLSRDTFIGLGLLAWFVALAIAEAVGERREGSPASHGDARLVTNFSLTILVIVASTLSPLAGVSASLLAERLGIGLAHQVAMPWAAVFALALLVQTFAAYWVHRLMHVTPLLWRVHRVHHADDWVDVSTSLRNHPFELLVTLPVSALVVLAIGAPVTVVVAVQTILVAAAIWQHADVRLPPRVDGLISAVLITPRIHRLHHDRVREVHDSNYGELIVLWDRLFGTLNLSEARGQVGLGGQATRPDRLIEQICSPLYAA